MMIQSSAAGSSEGGGRGGDRLHGHIADLLRIVSDEDLASILRSSTLSLIQMGPKVDGQGNPLPYRESAINGILLYNDAIGVLNRQRVKKSYLAKYLSDKGIRMTMPATKNSLCKDVLRYWDQAVPDNLNLIDDEASSGRDAVSSTQQATSQRLASTLRPGIPNQTRDTSSSPSALTGTESSTNAVNADVVPVQDVDAMEYETAVTARQREAQLGERLGREFSVWFYERLNTLTDFTASHFWSECAFRLEIILTAQNDHSILEEVMNGEICCAKLKDLVAVKQLYFNPNMEGGAGIRGYLNPHGLAQVMVCGVIHHNPTGNPVGVFEQMFGLMKDPTTGNNYKIKYSILRMREGGHLAVQNTPPELTDSSLVGIIEEVD